MNILHYTLGLPPYRTGGLTKYSVDLMREQVKDGDSVFLLWPGKIRLAVKETSIKKRASFEGIKSYELINPLPVSLINGINNTAVYTKPCDINVYKDFIVKIKPDIVHIHTLMGIHREFFDACRDLGVKTVFTSHDYFGLCPMVSLLYDSMPCDNDNGCEKCVRCNSYALSYKKLVVLQSPLYRYLKDSSLVKMLRRRFKNKASSNFLQPENIPANSSDADQYKRLREYYLYMLSSVDKIHFNSSNTKRIFSRFINTDNSEVISITHGDISNNKRYKSRGKRLRLAYLGPQLSYKGYNMLIDALDELSVSYEGQFELNIYMAPEDKRAYFNIHQPYAYSQLENVLESCDVVLCPSLWYETFGFTVLEALSYGVPVVITENVGAKDIVEDGKTGIVIKAEKKELVSALTDILNNSSLLTQMNRYIVENTDIKTMDDHAGEIKGFYGRV